jgi:hypothetical protein
MGFSEFLQGAYRCLASETTLPEFPRVLQQHRSFWPAAVLGQHPGGIWMACLTIL